MKKAEFLSRAIAKNIKKSRGHDGPSFTWDIYFDGKIIAKSWIERYTQADEWFIQNYWYPTATFYTESIEKTECDPAAQADLVPKNIIARAIIENGTDTSNNDTIDPSIWIQNQSNTNISENNET